MKDREHDVISLLDVDSLPSAFDTPLVVRAPSMSPRRDKGWLSLSLKPLVRRVFYICVDALRRLTGFDWTSFRTELADLRSFRTAAEAEIALLKEQVLSDTDQLNVQRVYLSALQSIVSAQDNQIDASANSVRESLRTIRTSIPSDSTTLGGSEGVFPSCRWIEGGLSFVPGHVRVCPNCNSAGGAPGLVAFAEGRLPVDTILARKEIIRRGNRINAFSPCTNCAYRTEQRWSPREYAFDILCISHATACNLACNYCHTIPEERYLQHPGLVPSLYGTIEALINEGHLAPNSLIQWGGGEPTILREFPALFRMLESHGAYSEVYSSGVRISEVLLESLSRNRAGVMVSLDAGTAETYANIKGRPAFDRVVANVARYASKNPGRTILKMILFENNLGEVSQFLDVAERTGVRIVCVDTPLYLNHVGDQFVEAAAFFCDEAERRGLEWRMGEVGNVFNPADRVAERIAGQRSKYGFIRETLGRPAGTLCQ
jgi:molybdenum cofactor biosynthesis enzyme MoaA